MVPISRGRSSHTDHRSEKRTESDRRGLKWVYARRDSDHKGNKGQNQDHDSTNPPTLEVEYCKVTGIDGISL